MTNQATPSAFRGDHSPIRPRKAADMVAHRIRRMIVRGELTDGAWLPTESQLMGEFGVSRPTLREAFRLLEADSLLTIRRGPPGGAKVTIPGPEAAAAQFGLLLTLAGTTISDVYEARMTIEPDAARRLATGGASSTHDQLAAALDEVKSGPTDGASIARASSRFHQRIVELAGSKTLAAVDGMLGEIISRHIAQVFVEKHLTSEEEEQQIGSALRAYEKLVGLVEQRAGEEAERFWVSHLHGARPYILKDTIAADVQVVDLLY